MKSIVFIRHAKSDWSNQLPDRQRPLNDRGKESAPEMGKRIRELDVKPDLILVSTAQRTQETYELLAPAANWTDIEKQSSDWIYDAMLAEYVVKVSELNDELSCVCFIGHNPTITAIASYLSGEYIVNMPTASVAIIDFEVDSWKEISKDSGSMRHYDFPKNENHSNGKR